MQGLGALRVGPERPRLARLLWLLSISKNAMCITFATLLANWLATHLDGGVPFVVVGTCRPVRARDGVAQ